jgi:thymidine phosphorylase
MVGSGQSLSWNKKMVVDKHCVEVFGNRTTPIVVSSLDSITKNVIKGITSPTGTADCLETMTKIDLSIKQIQK